MSMRLVYLVVGEALDGYSDFITWVVTAYPTREAAEIHARLLEQQSRGFVKEGEKDTHSLRTDPKAIKERLPLNPGARQVFREEDYVVKEVPFALHPDDFMEKNQ